jgi:VanZ family protein
MRPRDDAVTDFRGSPLARYLLIADAALVVYASLHPLSGWSATGVDPFAFLGVPPRYIVRFDIFANILGYAPLGFLAVLAAYPRWRGIRAVALATLAAVLLSFILEALQSYLPSRTPSNLDFAANSAGAIAGALIAAGMSESVLFERRIKAQRHRIFRPGRRIDVGLVLLGLWMFTQLDPQTLLFGGGDLRPLFQEPATELHPAEVFMSAEALVAGANTLAVGLLTALLAAPGQPVRMLLGAVIAAALLLHAVAYAVLFGAVGALNWLTPGAYFGVAAGLAMVLAAVALPRPAQFAVCALAVMAAAVVVNIAPENPYLAASLSTWRHGYFEHLVGLTRLLSGAWPFFALVYVVSLAGGESTQPL